jgi:hypothetical protein
MFASVSRNRIEHMASIRKPAFDPPRQQPRQVGLPHAERQLAQILAVADQHVEGVKFDLGNVPA